ncbi:hypothetical protein [Microlunatus sp. Gsoil 973]|uniref:hypothetical protein n=1 Tax=Microlunatus sp. Gsoil 973 TaxID=2672569 RepID=UPI0018A81D0B|nr:hypothetical protein [Microlunatus sp. Gsoil 973]
MKDFAAVADGNSGIEGIGIELAEAGPFRRIWYRPGIKTAALVAVTTWLATIASGVFALMRFLVDATTQKPNPVAKSLLITAVAVLGLVALSSSAKLIADLKAARR